MQQKTIKKKLQPTESQFNLDKKSDCLILQQLALIQKSFFTPNIYLWIDQNIHNTQNQEILSQLKINQVDPILCKTIGQAQKQIKNNPKDRFKIICSAAIGEVVCKQFHQHNQVIHIYIFCQYKPAGQVLQQKWSKIKFHTADVKQFLVKLKEQSKCDNRFSQLPNFMKITAKDNTHDNTLINKSRYNLHGLFLFKDRSQAKSDFVKLVRYFYSSSNKSLLQEFEKDYPINYNHQLALSWYTRETFFYKLLNNFLRSSSNPLETSYLRLPFDATFKAIKQIYDRENEKNNMTAYRGGFINDNQLEYLEKNVGQYIEIFGFMSTSTQIDVAKKFINDYKGNSLITVLIEDEQRQIKIDYGYANITKYSEFNQSQVLFNALNVFKVVSYKKQDQIHHIKLKYGELARIVYLGEDKLQQKQKSILINYKHQQEIIQKQILNQGDVFKYCQIYDSEVQYRKKHLDYYAQIQTREFAYQLDAIGLAYQKKTEYNKALQFYERSLKIKINILGEDHKSTAITLQNIGNIYLSKVKYNKALEYYQRSLDISRKVFGENDINISITLNNIGNVYRSKADFNKALEYYQKALEISINILGENHSKSAAILGNIGIVYQNIGDYTKALEYHQRSLNISTNIFGENHSSISDTQLNIGNVYLIIGDYNKALQFYKRSLRIQIKIFGESNSNTAKILNNIGIVYQRIADYNQALAYYQRSLNINKKLLGENHSSTADNLLNIGNVYFCNKEYNKGLQYFQRSLKIKMNIFGPNHISTADTLNNIGVVYQNKGEYKKSLQYYQKALKIKMNILGENHISTADTLRNIGLLYYVNHEYQIAQDYFMGCYEIRMNIFGPDHPFTIQILQNILDCSQNETNDK